MGPIRQKFHELGIFVAQRDHSHRPLPIRLFLGSLRALYLASKKFLRDLCFERAAALSFISILSLIPLGFLFIFFVRTFGLYDQLWGSLKTTLVDVIVPESRDKILEWFGAFEQNTFSAPTGIGSITVYVFVIAGLISSALWIFEASEKALNRIWGVTSSRSYLQRFTVFWLIVTASPFLLTLTFFAKTSIEQHLEVGVRKPPPVTSEEPSRGEESPPDPPPSGKSPAAPAGIEASPTGHPPEEEPAASAEAPPPRAGPEASMDWFAWLYSLFLPVAVASLAFFVVYLLLPAARVQLPAALVGALFAGVSWEIAKSVLSYIVPRAVTFSVYGSLGAIAAFFFWFYITWSVLLFGAQLSYAVQHPWQVVASLAAKAGVQRLPPGAFAVALAVEIAKAAARGSKPPTVGELAQLFTMTEQEAEQELRPLTPAYFHRSASEENVYYLSRDTDQIMVRDLLAFYRTAPETLTRSINNQETGTFLGWLEEQQDRSLGDFSVRDILNRNYSLRLPSASNT